MQPSKWQDEFHSHPEDRLFSKKASLFSFDNPFKYLSVFIGSVVAIGIIWYVSTSSPSLPDAEKVLWSAVRIHGPAPHREKE